MFTFCAQFIVNKQIGNDTLRLMKNEAMQTCIFVSHRPVIFPAGQQK